MNTSKLECSFDGVVAIIRLLDAEMLSGAFCADTQGLLLDAARKQPSAHIVVDLTSLLFVSSEGLGALLTLRSELQADSRKLCLAKVSPLVAEVFEMTQLDRLFPIETDVEAAKQRLATAG